MGILKGIKKTFDRVTGKHKLKSQYEQALEQVQQYQNETLAKLNAERAQEHAKIASERNKAQTILQAESERFLQEKTLLPKLLNDKEEHLTHMKNVLMADLELVRASLYACMNGQADIVEMLLKKDINLRLGFFELLPLHIAAENNQTEIIKLLCRYGVNLNRQNDNGTALAVAEYLGNNASVLLLRRISKQSVKLRKAVQRGDIVSIEEALSNNADINATNPLGYNALQLAIISQQLLGVVRLLVEKGADLQYGDEKAPYLLAKHHPDARVGTYLLELMRNTQGIFNEVHNETLLNGPEWCDTNRWTEHAYFSTIQSQLLQGNGYSYYIAFTRTDEGVRLAIYEDKKKAWQFSKDILWGGPGWGTMPAYYSTLKAYAFDNKGCPQVLIMGRGGFGVEFRLYDIESDNYIELPQGPGWTDKDWGTHPRYYSTIQAESYQYKGKPYFLILGRCGNGIDLYWLDINEKTYKHLGAGPGWSDKDWGQNAHYYSTIQMQVFLHFGMPKAFLLGRCGEGIDLYLYDITTQTLSRLPFGPQWSDGLNWFHPQYYGTIQARVALRQDGSTQLIVIGRNGEGICLSIFDLNTYTWRHFKGPAWSDANLWFLPDCYSTIQLNYMQGIEDDWVVTSGKGPEGFETHLFGLKTEVWRELPRVFLQGIDWSLVSHFSTIQFHCARINHEHRFLISARTPTGLKCWSYLINITELEQSLKTCEMVSLSHDRGRIKAFLEHMNSLAKDLLEASHKGDIVTLKECIRQGADINAIDLEGYNALQKAILSKKADIELVSCLMRAGIDIEHQTPRFETALSLAAHQPVSRLLRFEPLLGIQESLKYLDAKSVYQAHSDRAWRFLNQYSNDFEKTRAIEAYYQYIAQVEPYALYAKPAFWLFSELRKTIETQQKGFVVSLMPLQKAQDLFVKTRAMHCTLLELGLNKVSFMEGYGWKMVENSIQLKAIKSEEKLGKLQTIADKTRQEKLMMEGVESFLTAFFVEVLEGHLGKWKALTPYFVNLPKISLPLASTVVHHAAKSGLVQLLPKRHLSVGIKAWEKSYEDTEFELEQKRKALQEERKAFEEWLNQREVEYFAFKKQMETFIENTYAADSEITRQFQLATDTINTQFNAQRQELIQNFQQAKHKLEKTLLKNVAIIVAVAIVVPQMAHTLTLKLGSVLGVGEIAATMETLGFMVEGALAGSLTAFFTGNTRNILKDGFIGGWMGGFGSVAGNILKSSNTFNQFANTLFKDAKLQATAASHLRAALIAGAQTVIRTSIEEGKLTPAVLSNLGVALALGPRMTNESATLLEKMKGEVVRIGISSTIVSGITKQGFLETVGAIGIGDFAYLLGSHIHKQLFPIANGAVFKKYYPMKFPNVSSAFQGYYKYHELDGGSVYNLASIDKPKKDSRLSGSNRCNTEGNRIYSAGALPSSDPKTLVLHVQPGTSKKAEPLFISVLNVLTPEVQAYQYRPNEEQGLSKQDKRNVEDFLKQKHFYKQTKIFNFKDACHERRQNPSQSKMLLFSTQAKIMPNIEKDSFGKFNAALLLAERAEDNFINPNHEDLNLGTRSLGFLQASGGVGQMTAGATFCGPFAPVVGVMGMDNMVTGFQIMWTGRQHSTSLYQVADALGGQTGLYGQQGASYIEIGLNLGSTVNLKALTFAFGYGKASTSPALSREMLSGVALVGRTSEKSNQGMLRMWNRYRNNSLPNSSVDALRLKHQLTMSEHACMFKPSGELSKIAIENSRPLLSKLRNKKLLEELGKKPGNLSDWKKYETQPIHTQHGLVRVHFYKNATTDDIFYEIDYKAIYDHQGFWRVELSPKFDYQSPSISSKKVYNES